MADVSSSLKDWSTTEASNQPAGSTAISTNLDDNLRQIQATVRDVWSRTTVASAATCDIGAVDHGSMNISGTTTITSFGTVSAGIRKWLTFEGALTLTHNGTSLILPSGANITTAAGDTACFESLGSGNWRCLSYTKASGYPISSATVFNDGSVSSPSIAFSSDTDTGFYRIGSDSLGVAAGGALRATFSATNIVLDAVQALTVTSGPGYDITISADTDTSGDGGNIAITAGTTSDSAGSGGDVTITGGQCGVGAAEVGGSVTISGGPVQTGGAGFGGDVVLAAGAGSATANTGSVLVQGTTGNVLKIHAYRQHLEFNTTLPPTIDSGAGSGATITGSDNAFRIVFGTSAGTTIVVSYARTWAFAPMALCQFQSSLNQSRAVTTTTTITITLNSAPNNLDVMDVFCFGRSA